MRRRVMSIVLCAIIWAAVIVIEVPADVSAFESIMFVDDDNTSGIEDGTWTYPYNTIQEGVDAAKSGDGVYVFSGTYNERICISKSLHIMGEDRDITIIDAGVGAGDVVHISANWVNFTGFTIANTGGSWYDTGIELNNVKNCVIDDNDISSSTMYGIFLNHTSNNTISRNKIHNPGFGIEVWHSSYNTIWENEIYDNFNGICSQDSSNNVFINNTVHDNIGPGGGAGFFFSGTPYHDNLIIGNHVHNNNDGIHLEDQTFPDNIYYWNNSIIGNTVHNNRGDGIFIGGEGRNNYILNNTVYENGVGTINPSGGIHFQSSHNNSFRGNTLYNNDYGFLTIHGNYLPIKDNTITNNIFHHNNYGIYCFEYWYKIPPKYNTFSNNIFHHNNYGIYLEHYEENTIVGNTLESNSIYGIWLADCGNNTIYYNNLINNTNQAVDNNPSNNFWHHPDLLEGNYWTDYTGVDDGSGVGKHAIADDGIGDTLIPHPELDYDFYPLMGPWTPPITTEIDIDPDTLNLKSKGRWITCYIELPDNDVNDIDINSIILENTIPAEWGNVQNDTLMVKFDRSEVEDMLPPGTYNLKVSGELMDGRAFEGYSDEIRVIDPP